MEMVILVPFLVCLVGMLTYALAANPKVSEMGRLAFGAGLLVTLFMVGGRVMRL